MQAKAQDADLILAVAKALHQADRSGAWAQAAHKESWLKWARVAVEAVREHDARSHTHARS